MDWKRLSWPGGTFSTFKPILKLKWNYTKSFVLRFFLPWHEVHLRYWTTAALVHWIAEIKYGFALLLLTILHFRRGPEGKKLRPPDTGVVAQNTGQACLSNFCQLSCSKHSSYSITLWEDVMRLTFCKLSRGIFQWIEISVTNLCSQHLKNTLKKRV